MLFMFQLSADKLDSLYQAVRNGTDNAPDLVRQTQLSRTSAFYGLRILFNAGKIEPNGKKQGKVGRPIYLWKVTF